MMKQIKTYERKPMTYQSITGTAPMIIKKLNFPTITS